MSRTDFVAALVTWGALIWIIVLATDDFRKTQAMNECIRQEAKP